MPTATNTTVRLSSNSWTLLRRMADETGASFQDLVEMAIEGLWRQYALKRANQDYAALLENPELRHMQEQEWAMRAALQADHIERELAQEHEYQQGTMPSDDHTATGTMGSH